MILMAAMYAVARDVRVIHMPIDATHITSLFFIGNIPLTSKSVTQSDEKNESDTSYIILKELNTIMRGCKQSFSGTIRVIIRKNGAAEGVMVS